MALMSFTVWGISYLVSSYISNAVWLIFLLFQMIIYLVYGMYVHNLYIQANRDSLTGLCNRRYFTSKISDLSKMKFPISLMILDIDNFKMINDIYGHLAGDEILKQLAEIFKRNIRETELLSRWGGEEFTILLPNTYKETALRIAENLRNIVDKNVFDVDNYTISITISIGIATATQAIPPKQFVKSADMALHKAKETKNVVVSYKENTYINTTCYITPN
jgi:diguanylate cyclase (GGDEF)-like protein